MRTVEDSFRLKDGRRLGWAEFGDPGGRPVFYFHGWPGSRLEAVILGEEAERRGIRLLSPDRPGMGTSDFQPRRRIVDWPADVKALADRLGLKRFGVLGISGGGPYACACARFIPNRLSAAVVVAGMGPLDTADAIEGFGWWNRAAIAAHRRTPQMLNALFPLVGWSVRRFPGTFLRVMHRAMPAPDKPVVKLPEFRAMFRRHVKEVFREGSMGAYFDGDLYLHPWGFHLEEIEGPLDLWHGEFDRSVPPEMGRRIARAVPGCRARFCDQEGHLSIVANHLDEILETFR